MIRTRIVFTQQLDNGAGFAVREDDGAEVYLTKMAVHAVRPEVGRTYTAVLVPNQHPTAMTPWFAAHTASDDVKDEGYLKIVRDDLAAGGVHTGDTLAEAHGGAPAFWAAMLDVAYLNGECSKFVRFDSPKAPLVRAWYTAEPDAADVDVWEDAE